MPTTEIAVKVGGVEKAVGAIPPRLAKTVLLDAKMVAHATVEQQAAALLAWIRQGCQIDPAVHRGIGTRHYDVMVAALNQAADQAAQEAAKEAVEEADPDGDLDAIRNAALEAARRSAREAAGAWDHSRVEMEGFKALEAAFDALP